MLRVLQGQYVPSLEIYSWPTTATDTDYER